MKANLKKYLWVILLIIIAIAAWVIYQASSSGVKDEETSVESEQSEEVTEVEDLSESKDGEVQYVQAIPRDEDEQEEETDLDEVAAALENNTVGVNLIRNGDFSKGAQHFGVFMMQGGVSEFVSEEGVGIINIDSTGSVEYSNQFYHDGFSLKMGGVYEFSFDMASTLDRPAEVRIQLNGGDYKSYLSDIIGITGEMQHFTYTFEMTEGDDKAPRLCVNLGKPKGEDSLEPHTITVDNVSLTLVNADNIVESEGDKNTVDCNLNQVGYLSESRKIVTVRAIEGEILQSEFSVLNENQEVVYTGELTEPTYSEYADELVYIGDFSEFKEAGKYTVKVGEDKVSFPFEIGDRVYDELLMDAFHMLYHQRCGCEILDEYAEGFGHPACHTEEAIIYGTTETKEVSGGWHDAGDYGRYVAPGVQAAYDLILLYEDFPALWGSDDLQIPESGNGVPDVLDEARYEIDWLLKMQDTKTGGVYHKVTTKSFPDTIMPQNDTADLYLSPISTTATADFAAIMAKSSVVYRELDAEFADRCLAAAVDAWDWVSQTRNATGFKNPEDIFTGEYPDGQDKDERFWASVELYKATGEQKYLDFAHESMEKYILFGYGWAVMGGYGNIAYNTLDPAVQNAELYQKMKDMHIQKADKLVDNAAVDGYQNCLGDDYVWGSNMVVCNNAREMLFANILTSDEKYLNYAEDQLHYILGRNTVSYCFVTEYGTQSPKHSHHRPSTALGIVQKGMVIGGPNGGLQDPYSKTVLIGNPPAKCYIDNEQSYSVNEITIYWNTPFIYLLSSQMSK